MSVIQSVKKKNFSEANYINRQLFNRLHINYITAEIQIKFIQHTHKNLIELFFITYSLSVLQCEHTEYKYSRRSVNDDDKLNWQYRLHDHRFLNRKQLLNAANSTLRDERMN